MGLLAPAMVSVPIHGDPCHPWTASPLVVRIRDEMYGGRYGGSFHPWMAGISLDGRNPPTACIIYGSHLCTSYFEDDAAQLWLGLVWQLYKLRYVRGSRRLRGIHS